MNNSPIVSCAELAASSDWRIFDCRHDLAKPDEGKKRYDEGHIPGALHAHLDKDLAGEKTGSNGRHPLPEAEEFIAWLGQCGIRAEDRIIAYDDMGGTFAARLWWMLRWVGHESVAVLDGGYKAWQKAGHPVTQEQPQVAPTTYAASVNDKLHVDVRQLEANLDNQQYQIIDARSPERYAGKEEPIDPVAGHIPGAANRPNILNLNEQWAFKSAEQLREEFQALLGNTAAENIIHQCGSGITACHNLLSMEIAGLTGSRLYPGSWSEWCSDAKRPVATE